MSDEQPVVVWFRQDLRLTDNPAWRAAAATGAPVIAVYVLDDDNAGEWRMGGASRWWLHQSLAALNASLDGKLNLFAGAADKIIPALAEDTDAAAVLWNRCYEPWRIARDKTIKATLKEAGHNPQSFNGSLLFEPQQVLKKDGTPYRVFTPFYRNGYATSTPRSPAPAPRTPELLTAPGAQPLDDLALMPAIAWYETMAGEWTPGEDGARQRLDVFIEQGLSNYRNGRDRPDKAFVSRLSPHIHHGEISVNTLWQAVTGAADEGQVEHFRRELAWREFSYSLLYHFPELPSKNLQPAFDNYPWHAGDDALEAWQRGNTGYPIVDAGMRELWQTGYMHNRVRMIVGSFLVKNLEVHWHYGEDWFWDTLLDADLANNSASWQWVAGSGADAAPFFRIFNPVTQGEKFDPDGVYVRKYVPEIAELPNKYLHKPWEAPAILLDSADIRIGETYPAPVVNLKESRQRALDHYRESRNALER
ncbi:MAG: deoxyribodipyrimidine photo-lyase [Pseudomonadota bacterium]